MEILCVTSLHKQGGHVIEFTDQGNFPGFAITKYELILEILVFPQSKRDTIVIDFNKKELFSILGNVFHSHRRVEVFLSNKKMKP